MALATVVVLGSGVDHAVWFHRPVSSGRWLLVDVGSERMGHARRLTIGYAFDDAATHVASVAQEALVDGESWGRESPGGAKRPDA